MQNGQDETTTETATEAPNRSQIRDWWSRHAATTTTEPGMLPFAGATPLGLRYRQQAEWLMFRRMISLKRSMRVLELGCGAGRWAFRIAPFVRHMTAVDLSPEMIRIAQERQTAQGLRNINFAVAAAEEYFSDAKFDVIYLSSVDQYLEDNAFFNMGQHVLEMLNPGGVLIDRVTIRDGSRAYLTLPNGYWAVYRTFSELNRAFISMGLVFHSRRASHNPFLRLPYKITSRTWCITAIGLSLRIFPRISCWALEKFTKWMDVWRPIAKTSVLTSHDFLRYDMPVTPRE